MLCFTKDLSGEKKYENNKFPDKSEFRESVKDSKTGWYNGNNKTTIKHNSGRFTAVLDSIDV